MTDKWSSVFLTGQLAATDFLVTNIGYEVQDHRSLNTDISSPFARIFFVRSGRAVFHLPQGDIEARPGNLYLIPNYVSHAYECEPGFSAFYLYVFQRIHRQTDIFDLYEFPTEVQANESIDALLETYCRTFPQLSLPPHDTNAFKNHRAYHQYVQQYCNLQLHERMQLLGLIAIVFSFFMKSGRPRIEVTDPRIAQLVSYIQEHLTETISIQSLADRACLTKSYLIRTFRDTLGQTPLQYILQKKIQKAQTMLLGTELNVNEVARAVGFADTSYFIRLFRKNLGFTPQEYRAKLID